MPTYDQSLIDQLRLIRSDGVGPATYRRLLERYGSAEAALDYLPSLAKRGGKTLLACSQDQAEAEIDNLTKAGGRLLTIDDPDYPTLLATIEDAPPIISLFGRIDLLNQPSLAIVGARNATLNGRRLAEKLARELGQAGQVIVSGLARGIDTAAHAGSLATGTIAVLAGGVDNIYPPENRELYRHIAEQGVILSEMPWGIEPTNQHFPRRNRIIAGLSQATLLVEAAIKSGSLITTRLALEQGREVFAVPGSPLDPRHSGPNQLIKTGQAQLIENSQDVLDGLVALGQNRINTPLQQSLFIKENKILFDYFEEKHENHPPMDEAFADLGDARTQLLNHLSPTPTDTDFLVEATGMPIHQILTILLELELAGRLQRHAGNRVALIAA